MDVARIREDFPIYCLGERTPIYLDSACQTLRPRPVIEAVNKYYTEYPACGGRSVHRLATQVSIEVDEAREKMSRFLNASSPDEIVFTKNCTEALNLVAKGLGLKRGDVVLTSDMEHNSNLVPWQQLERLVGIRRGFVSTPETCIFDLEGFKKKMSKKVKVVSMVHTNNVNGVSIPAKEVAEVAHDHDALVLMDGAQAVPHMKVGVKDLDADFYALSVHKMLGPSGVGVLWGKKELLRRLEPLITGGGGVSTTTFEGAELLPPPERFEAGLMNYSGVIGTGAAVDYLGRVGMEEVARHDLHLNHRVTAALKDVPGLQVLAPADARSRGSIFSFNVKDMSSHDVAMILDDMAGVMIRSGMHCCHPYFVSRGLSGCARASFYIYNDDRDCDAFIDAVKEMVATFSK